MLFFLFSFRLYIYLDAFEPMFILRNDESKQSSVFMDVVY